MDSSSCSFKQISPVSLCCREMCGCLPSVFQLYISRIYQDTIACFATALHFTHGR